MISPTSWPFPRWRYNAKLKRWVPILKRLPATDPTEGAEPCMF
jgi:hypothetical protein